MPPRRKGPPNRLFRDARERLRSPADPEAPMSREELADACNQYLADKPDPDGPITANHIDKIERGVNTWPHLLRREAYRAVLGAQTNAEIGLFNRRRRPRPARGDVSATSRTGDLEFEVGDAAHWYRNLQDAVAVLIQMCASDLSRRSLLRAAPLVGAALISVERDWLLSLVSSKVEQAGGDGGSQAVAATYTMIEMLDEMDNRFGGGHARLAGVSYLSESVLPQLAQTSSGPERSALLTAAAQLASNTGWRRPSTDIGSGPAHSSRNRYSIASNNVPPRGGAGTSAPPVLGVGQGGRCRMRRLPMVMAKPPAKTGPCGGYTTTPPDRLNTS